MRIVDVCAFYNPFGGGVKTYVERKLSAATAAGHEMIVLAPGEAHGVTQRPGGGLVVTIPAPRLPFDRRYRYFNDEPVLHAALDTWSPDFVEVSSPWSSATMVARWDGHARRSLVMHADPLAAYAYRWFGGIATTATIDRGFARFWDHLRELDRQMDCVVSANFDLSRRLAEGGLERVVTVPMGVEPGLFSPARRDEGVRAAMLARCGLPPSATLLLGVGRYSTEKRWPMVIDASLAAGTEEPVGLVLVGDGRAKRNLVSRTLGSPHIVVGESVSDRTALATLIASADALVHGCEAETFCMVAAEAVASGTPLIVPDRGGAADHAVRSGGVRYDSGNATALRDAIVAFTRRPPAPRLITPVRTMDRHFQELFNHYRDLSVESRLAA